MFCTIQIVINPTKEGYANWELHNVLGYVDYDNKIMNRQRQLLSMPSALKSHIAWICHLNYVNEL
jgi:hypothetical protein